MSELRKDPILDRWVIIAGERGTRPSDFAKEAEVRPAQSPSSCPFCGNHEHMTPDEIMAVCPVGRQPNTPGWEVRVVPNKFPSLAIEGELKRSGIGLFDCMAGVGAHEVVIESPDHCADIATMPAEQVVRIIDTFIERVVDLRRDQRFRHIVVFRNYGAAAGASLTHPHSQIIALPIVPKLVKDRLTAGRDHYLHKERCIFCDLIEQELAVSERVVMQNQHFVVLSVFAARFPFEVNIFPLSHQHDFVLVNHAQKEALADILSKILIRYRDILRGPAYNLMIQTAPNTTPRPGRPNNWGTIQYDYHWHIELMPRLTKVAGFEWSTGFYINPVSPERAAAYLRGEAKDSCGE